MPKASKIFGRTNFVPENLVGLITTVRNILVGIPSDEICPPEFILGEFLLPPVMEKENYAKSDYRM